MALSTHVLAKKQDVAFRLVKVVKDKRPHVDASLLLEGKRIQDQFQKWYTEQRVQEQEQKIQEATWKEVDIQRVTPGEFKRVQEQKQTVIKYIPIQLHGTKEYYMNTFYNPYIEVAKDKKMTMQRECWNRKDECQNRLQLAINDQNQQIPKLEQIIHKVHIDSPDFEVMEFLRIAKVQNIGKFANDLIAMNQAIVYIYLDDFFNINQGIQALHEKHKEEILTGIQTRQSKLIETVNRLSGSFTILRDTQSNIQMILEFLRRAEVQFQMPLQMRKLLLQKKYAEIISIFKQFKKYEISLFIKLNTEMEEIIGLTQKEILNTLKTLSQDYNYCQQLLQFLIDLNTANLKELIIQTIIDDFQANFKGVEDQDFLMQYLKNKNALETDCDCDVLLQQINNFKQKYLMFQKLMPFDAQRVVNAIQPTLQQFLSKKSWNTTNIAQLAAVMEILFQLFPTIDKVQFQALQVSLSIEQFKLNLKSLKCVFVTPNRDIFGIRLSQFINDILNRIRAVIIQKNIDGTIIKTLLQISLEHIQTLLTVPFDYLILMHNLRVLVQQMPSIAEDLHSITQQKVPLKTFYENINVKTLADVYRNVLTSYVRSQKFELPQQMDVTPRPYVVKWLTYLNDQAMYWAQLNPDPMVPDSLITYIGQIFLKLHENVQKQQSKIKPLRQLTQEIQIIDTLTKGIQGKQAKEIFQTLISKLEIESDVDISIYADQFKALN